METQIQIKINQLEKNIIMKAAKFVNMGYSTFCRSVSLKEARRVLNEVENATTN